MEDQWPWLGCSRSTVLFQWMLMICSKYIITNPEFKYECNIWQKYICISHDTYWSTMVLFTRAITAFGYEYMDYQICKPKCSSYVMTEICWSVLLSVFTFSSEASCRNTQLLWITWTLMSDAREKPLNIITHTSRPLKVLQMIMNNLQFLTPPYI